MGTQFTSRLTDKDRQQIIEGIVDTIADLIEPPELTERRPRGDSEVSPAKPKAQRPKPATKKQLAAGAGAIGSLSGGQLNKFTDAVLGQVLTVANKHGFFSIFEESALFEDILKWLKRLRSDAEFNGFSGIISEYKMKDSVSPVRDLTEKLEELTQRAKADPFRVAATTAAKAILAETVTRKVTPKTGESPAENFGRKLATFPLQDLVNRYINSFVYEVVSKTLSMSDPHAGVSVIQQTLDHIPNTTSRIARKAVEQIKAEGKLCNVKRTHEIVLAGLRNFAIK